MHIKLSIRLTVYEIAYKLLIVLYSREVELPLFPEECAHVASISEVPDPLSVCAAGLLPERVLDD